MKQLFINDIFSRTYLIRTSKISLILWVITLRYLLLCTCANLIYFLLHLLNFRSIRCMSSHIFLFFVLFSLCAEGFIYFLIYRLRICFFSNLFKLFLIEYFFVIFINLSSFFFFFFDNIEIFCFFESAAFPLHYKNHSLRLLFF